MHSTRMRTARSSGRPGGSPPGNPLGADPPQTRHPQEQTPLPVSRITDTCKNITLPQTSFAGGKDPTQTPVHLPSACWDTHTCPWEETSLPGRHPPCRHTPLDRHTPLQWPLQRTVHMLLECFLVF